MARSLGNELMIARSLLRQEHGWLLFAEVALHNGRFVRLVQNERHLKADGRVWQAASVALQVPEEDDQGNLGQMVFAVSNITREPLRLVEVENDLLGCPITVWLQHSGNLEAFVHALSWTHVIVDSEIDERTARFTAGHEAAMHRVPGPLFTRSEFPQLLSAAGIRL